MNLTFQVHRICSITLCAAVVCIIAVSTPAQDARPAPTPPREPADDAGSSRLTAMAAQEAGIDEEPDQPVRPAAADPDGEPGFVADLGGDGNGELVRTVDGEQYFLAFEDEKIDRTFPFLMEATGKIVIPLNRNQLTNSKITVMMNSPVSKQDAVNTLYRAFRSVNIGVTEIEDFLFIHNLSQTPDLPFEVLGPDDDVMARKDIGSLVKKIYRIKYNDAEQVHDLLSEGMPGTWTKLDVDANTSQIVLVADIALCQHVQRVINHLDQRSAHIAIETFALNHANAQDIEENILDLFEGGGSQSGQRRGSARSGAQSARERAQRAQAGEAGTEVVELRVTSNVQQNSVTVSGSPSTVDSIRRLIHEHWDLPLRPDSFRVYRLKYTDPIKIATLLQTMLEEGGGSAGGGGRRPTGGTGGGGDVSQIVRGIFNIEPFPDAMMLVVLSKTEKNFAFFDNMINELDKPLEPALPSIVPLRYAEAFETADLINAILARTGARQEFDRPTRGLTGLGVGASSEGAGGGTLQDTSEEAAPTSFWWQTGSANPDEQAEPTPLIGAARIVPVGSQNALCIVAPPEFRDGLVEWVSDQFDRPSPQVRLSAVFCEVELTDDMALGLRFSNSDEIFGGALADNRVGVTNELAASESNLLSRLFETSMLDSASSVNVVLQALAQKTNIRVVNAPYIFTADNQEAAFFDGQIVPVSEGSFTADTGGVTENIGEQNIGVTLNARPRITPEGNIDLEVRLNLSSIAPGERPFGNFIFNDRQTYTKVIMKDGQTVMLSGILREQESEIKRGLPLLSDIPILGELFFTSRENSKTRSELIAFITPTVVGSPDDINTEESKKHLQNMMLPLPESKKIFKDPDKWREHEKRIMPDYDATDDEDMQS